MLSAKKKSPYGGYSKFAPECIVLLENDGVLPLKKTGKLALYGAGARMTVKGGTGSGDVNSRTVINIEQGLEAAGFEITTKSWMDGYSADVAKAKQDYFMNLKARAAKEGVTEFAPDVFQSI